MAPNNPPPTHSADLLCTLLAPKPASPPISIYATHGATITIVLEQHQVAAAGPAPTPDSAA